MNASFAFGTPDCDGLYVLEETVPYVSLVVYPYLQYV